MAFLMKPALSFQQGGTPMIPKKSTVPYFFIAMLFVLMAAHPVQAGFDRGPWAQNVTQDSVQLIYEGDKEDGNGLLEYGTTLSYGDSVTATKRFAAKDIFWADLTSLASNTLYYYRLTHEGSVREGSFYTAPGPTDSFTFAVVGDTRSGHADHQAVVDAIIANEGYPDLYLNSGDLIASGEVKDDWRTFFSIEDEILRNTVFGPSFGNHESGEFFNPTLYGDFFNSGVNGQFWYAFEYGNSFFLVINTEKALGGGGLQENFVDDQLQAARDNPDIEFIFVLFHAPGVTTSASHKPNLAVLNTLLDKLEEHNVDAVFTGHNHLYEHGIVNGVHHIVTGGGGAGLYGYIDPYTPDGWTIVAREVLHHYCYVDVTVGSYSVECKEPDGTVIDSFTETAAGGGFPGPTPQDLLDRATEISCGSFVTKSLGLRVKDVDASTRVLVNKDHPSLAGHVAANGFLYAIPALFIMGLRRRFRKRP